MKLGSEFGDKGEEMAVSEITLRRFMILLICACSGAGSRGRIDPDRGQSGSEYYSVPSFEFPALMDRIRIWRCKSRENSTSPLLRKCGAFG